MEPRTVDWLTEALLRLDEAHALFGGAEGGCEGLATAHRLPRELDFMPSMKACMLSWASMKCDARHANRGYVLAAERAARYAAACYLVSRCNEDLDRHEFLEKSEEAVASVWEREFVAGLLVARQKLRQRRRETESRQRGTRR